MKMLIRLATPDDAPALREIYAPFIRESVISFETEVPSIPDFAQRIQRTLDDLPWLVWEEDDTLCGYAYAGKHRVRAAYQWSADCSVYVAPEHHRKGIARKLYQALFALITQQGYVNLYAGATLPNDASVGFHESMGFSSVGTYTDVGYKFGKWHDVHWWHRPLCEPPARPTPPTPLPLFLDAMTWRTIDEIVPDETFLSLFLNSQLPKELWDHKAHVRMAWLILQRSTMEEALPEVRDALHRLVAVINKGMGYHETVTQLYLHLIHHAMQQPDSPSRWPAFFQRHPELFDRKQPISLRYYSKERLLSEEARQNFLPPDRQSLP